MPNASRSAAKAMTRRRISHPVLEMTNRIEFIRLQDQVVGEAQPDHEHENAEQEPQLLAANPLPGARSELRADNAADHPSGPSGNYSIAGAMSFESLFM